MIKEIINSQKKSYPFIPLRESIVFPHMVVPFYIGRTSSLNSIHKAIKKKQKLVVATQKKITTEMPNFDDIYTIGVVGSIVRYEKLKDNSMHIIFEAEHKVKILDLQYINGIASVKTQKINPVEKESKEIYLYAHSMLNDFKEFFKRNKKSSEIIQQYENNEINASILSYIISAHLKIDQKSKQKLLSQNDVKNRLSMVYEFILKEKEISNVQAELKENIQKRITQTQKKHFLNEQLRAIQQELGQDDQDEIEQLIEKTKKLKMPNEVEEVLLKEIHRLKMSSPSSSEANILRNYIDWLHDIPWSTKTKDCFNIKKVAKQLGDDHYGLEKVKERIIEHIAVTKKVGKIKGPILCLVGPPGVGKTSLAKSVAQAMNRNFVRISLGGVRDEAEIRGHRRTYIGAMTGKIMQKMKMAKTNNPLILLDEVDKMSYSNMGDPAAALLEVLDPSQNKTFTDHYIEVEYDLSNVLFFCTANSVQDIPIALYDRMEIIQLSGYTELEKYHIFKQHLHKKITFEHGLEANELQMNKHSILDLIRHYTKEAGVRELERKFSKICRKVITEMSLKDANQKYLISRKKLCEILGIEQYKYGIIEGENSVGLVNGLAWSTTGGDVLKIEAINMKGKGNIVLTGKLGDVMKESAHAAIGYIRSKVLQYNISHINFQEIDIHIHALEGAIPKDGPSAGIALTTVILSSLTNIPIKKDIAMTGEVSLRGTVLAIGGLKEKLLAAKRAGVIAVAIPLENKKDVIEMSDEVKENIKIKFVSNVEDVIEFALVYPIADKKINLENDPNPEKHEKISHKDDITSTSHQII